MCFCILTRTQHEIAIENELRNCDRLKFVEIVLRIKNCIHKCINNRETLQNDSVQNILSSSQLSGKVNSKIYQY
jgi:hypothetical protein